MPQNENDLLAHLQAQGAQIAPPLPVIPQAQQLQKRGANMLPGETYEQYNARMAAGPQIPAMPTIPAAPVIGTPTPEQAQQAVHGAPTIDLNAMIAEARQTTDTLAPADPDVARLVIPADQAEAVAQVYAQALADQELIKPAEARLKQAKAFLKELIGDSDELVLNGTVIFSVSRSTSRIVDQAFIKANFPDDESGDNDVFWISSERTNGYLK